MDPPTTTDRHSDGVNRVVWVHITCEVLSVCEWVYKNFPQAGLDFSVVQASPRVLQWAITVFNFEVTASSILTMAAYCAPYLTRWAVEERHIAVTAELFMETCANMNDSVSLVKWLSERAPTLNSEQLWKSLCSALISGNLQTASWLEDTFHVMSVYNTESLCSSILEVCTKSIHEKVIEWPLKHTVLSSFHSLPEQVIVEAIKKTRFLNIAFVLLQEYHPNMLKHEWTERELRNKLAQAVHIGLPEVKKLVSLLGKELLSKESVTRFLTSDNEFIGYGHVAKWLIQEFDLGSAQVKDNHNFLLFRMLSSGRNHCAEWIITSFGVTLTEVITMMSEWTAHKHSIYSSDLETCKIIMRHFPSLRPDMFKVHFMPFTLASPVTAQFVIDTFPTEITKDSLKQHCSSQQPGAVLLG
ncbi:hypothetical protein Pelo_1931 [Pelomyxa schiedti]|nr:hypothetical protein Pelo_1931 [Pelomyxa schiedti]